MMFSPENYSFILEDCIYAMSVGFIVSFINEILKSIFYKNKRMVFIKDVLLFIIFSIIIFSYVISFANYPVLRWYHVVFSAFGFFVSRFSFSRILKLVLNCIFVVFSVFCKHFKNNIKIKVKFKEKTNTKAEKINNSLLKSYTDILYNE